MLERFLNDEVNAFADQQRQQAYVLGLDAQYGEGKSWFLSRFRQQLELNHPVAFIDAWVDDANNEPLVSIMSALQDALEKHLKRPSVYEQFGRIMRAAGPILGKAVIGAAVQIAKRHVGAEVGETVSTAIAGRSSGKVRPAQATDASKAEEAAVDSFGKDLTTLVDETAKAMVSQYKKRKESRETFKTSLAALASTLAETNPNDDAYPPIYVIVDELDRCRPAYAISLLEEIKHLFDVPGVVFIIALHGQQLEHSIKAVYGTNFDSNAYLRRFFTRKYELRRPSVKELVVASFHNVPEPVAGFSAPPVDHGEQCEDLPPAELVGELLSAWGVTPREVQAIIDGLRIFCREWNYRIAIELPLLSYLLIELVRGGRMELDRSLTTDRRGGLQVNFSVNSYSDRPQTETVIQDAFLDVYRNAMHQDLAWYNGAMMQGGVAGYVQLKMQREIQSLHSGRTRGPMGLYTSVCGEYPERLRRIGRMIER